MIHQPTLTPAEFRMTPLWQSIAPAIAHAASGAALEQQFTIAWQRIVEQAGPNISVGLVELEYARSITHLPGPIRGFTRGSSTSVWDTR
jgi:hypothetical protein